MCECVPAPPIFDIGLPPDPTLIWHLISDELFQGSDDCTWDPFISISDETATIRERNDPKTLENKGNDVRVPIFVCALMTVLLLFILITIVAIKFRRKSLQSTSRKKKTPSADHILTAPDNTWSYNSMKTTPNSVHGSLGILMYGDARNAGSMVFHKNPTPNTIRSYRTGECPLRQSATTIRLNHPGDSPAAAYHTLGRHYEEIPSRFASFAPSPLLSRQDWQNSDRISSRRPPPSSRPPPPPPTQSKPPEYVIPTEVLRKFHSPGCSDSSLDNELVILPNESPQMMKRWDETGETRSRLSGGDCGRESGYGTTPSTQWKTSPGREDARERGEASAQHERGNLGETHSMTYV
ncbi:unnamed protein product, partial [Mesorhabditis belari]|uniref:Uncharacterized protein n=1 Tax=Mesorhabditis belari TaxID=2138241 RepID=A0AAF3F2M3_9BILA